MSKRITNIAFRVVSKETKDKPLAHREATFNRLVFEEETKIVRFLERSGVTEEELEKRVKKELEG